MALATAAYGSWITEERRYLMSTVCLPPAGSQFEQLHDSYAQVEETPRRTAWSRTRATRVTRGFSEWHCGVACSLALHVGIASLVIAALALRAESPAPSVMAFSASLVELPDYAERSASPHAQVQLAHLALAERKLPATPERKTIRREAPPKKSAQAALPPELSLAAKRVPADKSPSKPLIPVGLVPLKGAAHEEAAAVENSSNLPAEGSGSGGTAPVEGAEVIGALRSSYAQVVAARLERAKRFPQRAMQRGIEGEVVLRLKIASDGQPEISRIDDSSGYEILDGEVLRMVDRASPFPKPPAGLVAANRLEYIIPVSFRLRG